MTVTLYENDLPDNLDLGDEIAVDTETMGLNPHRDRLCLVQLSSGDGNAHLVRIAPGQDDAPNLRRLLEDEGTLKIFHFARFDVAALLSHLTILCAPVYCTKIASRLCRTYTDKHSLRDLCRDFAGIELNKQKQCSDWGGETLSQEQLDYAASDVLYLHTIRKEIDKMLVREERAHLADACFDFVPVRAILDLEGWADIDIFEH